MSKRIGYREISEQDSEQAQALVDVFNEKRETRLGYFIIDVTGMMGEFYTLWRFNALACKGVNPYTYIKNLSKDYLTAVKNATEFLKHTSMQLMAEEVPTMAYKRADNMFWFGKHEGELIQDVWEKDQRYVLWFAREFIPKNDKQKRFMEICKQLKDTYYTELTIKNEILNTMVFPEGTVIKDELELKVKYTNLVQSAMYGSPTAYYTVKGVTSDNTHFQFTCSRQMVIDGMNVKDIDSVILKGHVKVKNSYKSLGINHNVLTRVTVLKVRMKGDDEYLDANQEKINA